MCRVAASPGGWCSWRMWAAFSHRCLLGRGKRLQRVKNMPTGRKCSSSWCLNGERNCHVRLLYLMSAPSCLTFSYTKGDLDFTYVTSRIIGKCLVFISCSSVPSPRQQIVWTCSLCVWPLLVMSFPLDNVDIGFRNQVDDIRSFLDSRHLDHYTVYNLSPKSYRTAKFHSRVRNFHSGEGFLRTL